MSVMEIFRIIALTYEKDTLFYSFICQEGCLPAEGISYAPLDYSRGPFEGEDPETSSSILAEARSRIVLTPDYGDRKFQATKVADIFT